MDQQTTKIKKLQEDMASKDAQPRAQLEAQLAKENTALNSMQVVIPNSTCLGVICLPAVLDYSFTPSQCLMVILSASELLLKSGSVTCNLDMNFGLLFSCRASLAPSQRSSHPRQHQRSARCAASLAAARLLRGRLSPRACPPPSCGQATAPRRLRSLRLRRGLAGRKPDPPRGALSR